MNRGMVRVRRDLRGHQVQLLPLFKQELWEQLTQSRVSIASEHLREGEASPQYLWETCGQCLVTLTVKCLLVFSENPVFQVVPIASRPVAGYPTEKSLSPSSLHPSFRFLQALMNSPWSFFSPDWIVPVLSTSPCRVLLSLCHLCGSSLDSAGWPGVSCTE